eukprot:TCONS_00058404-protein
MSASDSSSEEDHATSKEEPKIKPKAEIRSIPLVHALKTFVVENVMKHYTVAAIRALMKPDSKVEIWQVRQALEKKFSEDAHIAGFVSCGTALKTKYKGQDIDLPGISFFVMFDWAECAIDSYENHLSKVVMNSGLDIYNCRALRGRKGDYLAKALCVTVKDHTNETVLMAFVKSQIRVVRAEAKKEGIEMKNVHLEEGQNYSSKTLTKLWMTQRMAVGVANELRPAIQKLQQWIAIKIVDDSLSG